MAQLKKISLRFNFALTMLRRVVFGYGKLIFFIKEEGLLELRSLVAVS